MMSSSDSWTDSGEGDEPPVDSHTDSDADFDVDDGVDGAATVNHNGNGVLNGADSTDEHPLVSQPWPDDELVPAEPAEVLGLDGALHSWPAADGHEMPATAKLQQAIAEHIAVFTEDEVDDSWVEWPTQDDMPNRLPRFGGMGGHNGNGNGGHNGNGNGHGSGDSIVRPPQPPFDGAAHASDQHGPGAEPYAGSDPNMSDSWDGAGSHPPHQAQPPAQPQHQQPQHQQPQYQQPAPPPPRPPASPPPSAIPAPYEDKAVDGPMPVDQVAVRKLGGFNFLSVAQWAVLPRDEKARLIKSESVIFLNEGENVPLRSALMFFKGLNTDPEDGSRRRR